MENRKTKAQAAHDRKLLNSLVKEPVWSIIVCTAFLIISFITAAILAVMYFGSEEPIPAYFDLFIMGIVDVVVFLVILLVILARRYKDVLLPGEKILFVGEAPIWPVVLCCIVIAFDILAMIGLVLLFFLPPENLFSVLFAYDTLWLVRTLLIVLVETVAVVLIAVLLLRPKFFLTNKRIIGHSRRRWYRFALYTSLFYTSITSVHVSCWHHLCIGSPAGDCHFYFIKNAPEAYKTLVKMQTEAKKEDENEEDYEDDFYDYDPYFAYRMPPVGFHAPAEAKRAIPQPAAPAKAAPAQSAPAPARDFSGYKNGKPVVPKMPPKPRVPKF